MFEASSVTAGQPFHDPKAMLEELAGSDPRMAMLLQMMQGQHREASNDDSAPDERDTLIAELSERLDASEARLTKMTRIARKLHEDNVLAINRLGRLASALGACGLCWGEDDDCPGCRGRGRVGMVRPDAGTRAELFGQRAPVHQDATHQH